LLSARELALARDVEHHPAKRVVFVVARVARELLVDELVGHRVELQHSIHRRFLLKHG